MLLFGGGQFVIPFMKGLLSVDLSATNAIHMKQIKQFS